MRFVSTLLVLTTLLTVGASKEAAIDPVTGKYEATRKGSLPELEGATFWCATLIDVDFHGNVLKGVKFGGHLCGAILIRVSFFFATMNDVML